MALLHLPQDLTEHVILFLDLRSMVALFMTTKKFQHRGEWVWKLWKRSCSSRWRNIPIDRGAGIGLPFNLDRDDWFHAALGHEWIEDRFSSLESPSAKIESIVNSMGKNMHVMNISEEGMRWIIEIFDEYGENEVKDAAPDELSLRKMVFLASRSMHNQQYQHLAVKVFGILSLNEAVRQILPVLGAVDLVIVSMKIHYLNQALIENALWTLVILGRPLGSFEGSPFPHRMSTSISHVSQFMSDPGVGVVAAVVDTIRNNTANPGVLAKAFWAIVNLSLLDCNKQTLVELQVIRLIVKSMVRFPSDRELQFRACFALINLSLHTGARMLIRRMNGIEAILDAMIRFEDFPMLQRCACNVLVSLAWGSRTNRERMAKKNATELVNRALTKFGGFRDITEIGQTFLSLQWQ